MGLENSIIRKPELIMKDVVVKLISVGEEHCLILKNNGELMACGK
jgi:alpha-tubulin suppressor-like RCC1 family protein